MALRFLNNLIVSGESTFQVIPSIGTSFLGDNSVFAASTAFVQAALANLPTPFQFNTTSTTGIESPTNTASGNHSTAMGRSTTASQDYSTAMGYFTEASGTYSTAMGRVTLANGDISTAMGNGTEASNFAATAMGSDTKASGDTSTAMGLSTEASGESSTAMGRGTVSSGADSTAMGDNTEASGYASTAMGQFNVINSSDTPTTFALTNTAFSIGNGTTAALRSDAFSVKFNGDTAIAGDTDIEGSIVVQGTGTFNSVTDQVLNLNSTDDGAVYTAFKRSNIRIGYVGYGGTGSLLTFANELSGAVTISNPAGSLVINTNGSARFSNSVTIGTSTPISGSMFAVSRTSAPTSASPTVGVFHDINYTGSSSSITLWGGVTRNQYSGSDTVEGVKGANNIARILSSSSGDVKEMVGTQSESEHKGSGDVLGGGGIVGIYGFARVDSSSNFSVNQMIGSFQQARILNTGTQTVTGQVTGSVSEVEFNNPNATSAQVIASHVFIEAVKGNLGNTTLLELEMDGDYSTPDASLSFNNFAYIKAPDNFAMPNVTGTSHFINSSVPLPSVFAGAITAPSFIGSGAGLTGLPFNFNTTSTTGIESPTNTASGIGSTAMGNNTQASEESSTAMGESTIASGESSTAMGRGTVSSGTRSTAMGFGTEAKGYSSTAMGQFNIITAADNATTYSATNTAFSIGNGTNDIIRSDAFSVKFNGNTSIAGTTDILSNLTVIGTAEVRNRLYLRDDLQILNKAGDNWLTFGDRNISAAEAVYDLDNIGTISATGAVVAASFSGNGAALTSLPVSLNTPTAGIFSSSNGASGDYSTAFGLITSASGDFSTAMGKSTVSFATYSTAMGNNTQARGYGSISMGQFNVLNTGDNPTSYSATNIAFSIGNGGNNANRSDAFSIKFNGDTSIAGSIESTSFITKNGTSSQFTKADGSLDSREFPSLKASAPANSSGQAGDKAGDMFFSSAFLYYCVTDFVAAGTQCWQRIAKDATAW